MPHSDQKELLRIEQVLDALNCGAAIIDRAGFFVYVNNRMLTMMQRNRDDVIGQNVRQFYTSPADLAYLEIALAHSDESRDAEFVLPQPDGSRIPIVSTSRPLSAPFQHLHVVTVTDISAQKHAEDDLRENMQLIQQVGDNALEHALELKGYSEVLEKRVQQRTDELRAANLDAIYMLAIASEAKDADTGRHVRRIQRYAESLARELGLNTDDAHTVGQAAILHDVGKIHIPDLILKKPGPLDDDERFTMRQHTLFGERILSKRPFFDRARKIARSHHENWDGSGYPDGLAREDIPLEARIVRVVDVYDALTTQRVYKSAWPAEKAIEFIENAAGTHFDPEISQPFVKLFKTNQLSKLAEMIRASDEI